MRQVCIATYTLLKLALVVLVAAVSHSQTIIFTIAATLQFLVAVCILPLSFLEYRRSVKPSTLLTVYLVPTLLLEVAQTRTFWLVAQTPSELAYVAVFTAAVALKATILALEAQPKTRWLRWDTKAAHSPEESSGIYSLGVYFWLNKIFLSGYNNILQIGDLYPLDQNMSDEVLYERFQKKADYSKMNYGRYRLAWMLVRTLKSDILLAIVPRLALAVFVFCQPFMINGILDQLSLPESTASANISYGFIGAAALMYDGIAISTALYWYFHYCTLIMARGILVTAIFTKAVEAQVGSGDHSASLTLMSVDIERILAGFASIHGTYVLSVLFRFPNTVIFQDLCANHPSCIRVVGRLYRGSPCELATVRETRCCFRRSHRHRGSLFSGPVGACPVHR